MQEKKGVDDEDDLLITECLLRVPKSRRKRLRDVAWEELWAAGGEHVPDFSTLPKNIWGMIAARCEVSKRMLTTLLLLNKERISAAVWARFRFPSNWDYEAFVDTFMHKGPVDNNIGRPTVYWRVFGIRSCVDFFKPVERFAASHLAGNVWRRFRRETHKGSRTHAVMRHFSGNHALICISKLLSMYVPCAIDIATLSDMFRNVGCTVTWLDDLKAMDEKIREGGAVLKPIPTEMTNIKCPISSVHVALGYYNEYRHNAFKDYGVRLPSIELNLD